MMAGWQGGLGGQLFLVWASPAAACSSWSLRKNRPGQGRAAAAQPLNAPRFCSRPLAWTVTLHELKSRRFPGALPAKPNRRLAFPEALRRIAVRGDSRAPPTGTAWMGEETGLTQRA